MPVAASVAFFPIDNYGIVDYQIRVYKNGCRNYCTIKMTTQMHGMPPVSKEFAGTCSYHSQSGPFAACYDWNIVAIG